MMYHFILGFPVISADSGVAAAAGAPISGVSSDPLLSCFTVSSIVSLRAGHSGRSGGPSLVCAEVLENPVQRMSDHAIDHPEVDAEDKDRDDDDHRRRFHFLAVRRGHLAHLVANIAVKRFDALRSEEHTSELQSLRH